MSARLSKKKFNLVCVAHPDDETIFFGGLLLSARRAGRPEALPFTVVCVTSDGNPERRKQFAEACGEMGVDEYLWWEYPDRYESRLDVQALVEQLKREFTHEPETVFTHGIVGEYGHPHHQDVSLAVHEAFLGRRPVYSPAYNCFPEMEIKLSAQEYALKARILTKIYGSETSRFLNVLPATFVEGFLRLNQQEILAVYDFLARQKELRESELGVLSWLADYLPRMRNLSRPF